MRVSEGLPPNSDKAPPLSGRSTREMNKGDTRILAEPVDPRPLLDDPWPKTALHDEVEAHNCPPKISINTEAEFTQLVGRLRGTILSQGYDEFIHILGQTLIAQSKALALRNSSKH